MFTFISIVIVAICVILTIMVLVQNSKGGGLASSFSSSNQVMGVRKTTDFLEKGTWYLAGILVFLTYISAAFIPTESVERGLLDNEQIESLQAPTTEPSFLVAPESGTTPATSEDETGGSN